MNQLTFFTSLLTLLLCCATSTLSAQDNVGIGTTTPDPSARLHVFGKLLVEGELAADGDNHNINGGFSDVTFNITNTSSNPTILNLTSNNMGMFSVQSNGNTFARGTFGVGVSNPQNGKLEVDAGTGTGIYVTADKDATLTGGILTLSRPNNSQMLHLDNNEIISDGDLYLNREGSGNIIVADAGSGALLVGTQIGNQGRVVISNSLAQPGLHFTSPGTAAGSNPAISISDRLRISGDNIDSPSGNLFINNQASTNLYLGGGGGKVAIGNQVSNDFFTVNGDSYMIGNVGINRPANPSFALDIRATSSSQQILRVSENNGDVSLRIDNDGDAYFSDYVHVGIVPVYNTNNDYDATINPGSDNRVSREGSSLRYKENVKRAEIDFRQLLQLEAKHYNMREGYGRPGEWLLGVIAEEAHALGLTDLVLYDQEGRPDGIKYKKIGVILLEVVKEQDRTIQQQQTEIDELKARLDRIEALLKK